jgi:large subunit ribosomal protein L18
MKNRKELRARRHQRLRQRIKGTAERPRMSVCVSNQHIYVQFVDDDAQCTLASASTAGAKAAVNCAAARTLGQTAAEAALAKGISRVVVDRGGFKAAVAAGLSISDKTGTGDKTKTEEESK